MIDKYVFGGKFPEPDFIRQGHICCSHAKWYQMVRDLEGKDIPYYCIDVSVDPYEELTEDRLEYIVG